MAEEVVKKKRGRPPKNKTVNEKANSDAKEIKYVTTQQITSRLRDIFTGMHERGIPYTNFASAINRSKDELMNTFLQNPYIQNQRIKNSNSNVKLSSKTDIQHALLDPENNERKFRESSMALFYSNYIYSSLIRLSRDVPQFFNYVVPQYVTKEDISKADFKKEYKFVNKFVEAFNIPFTFKNVSMQIAQEGKCSYVFRTSYDKGKSEVDFALLQKLPPEYIKYTGYGSDSPLIVSFNFMMFLNPMYDISQWPQWFGDIWLDLQETGAVDIKKSKNGKPIINPAKMTNPNYSFENIDGSYFLYVELPQDLVYTFGTDFSHPLALPDYIGLFGDLAELDSYKWLQAQTLLTNITNILTAEVPVEKDAKGGSDAAILSPEVILGLEAEMSSSVSSNIFPFFAPLQDFELHSVEHVPNAQDIYLSAVRNVISTAGVSGLVNTNEKPSIAAIKGEQYLFESRVNYLSIQYEKFMNMIMDKQLGLKYDFKCSIWGGVYSYRDELVQLKEMVKAGNKGFLPRLLSAYRMTVDDYKAQYDYVDSLDLFKEEEEEVALKQQKAVLESTKKGITSTSVRSETSSKETTEEIEESRSVGRPALSEDQIENDNTAASVEGGENVSENK